MVKLRKDSHLEADGSIRLEAWLHDCLQKYQRDDIALIRHACILSQLANEHRKQNHLQQGLVMAEILLDLNMDREAIAAAIVYPSIQFADLHMEDVAEQLGEGVAKLVRGVEQMDALRSLHHHTVQNRSQIENLRKMLLAMVEDVRVVIIKLAERTWILRTADHLNTSMQNQIARESLEIYAPLANRLGIGQLKWEMEDLAFRYLEPQTYKKIAKCLDQRRLDRVQYIHEIVQQLQDQLSNVDIKGEVHGRAKHIYSIYRKMQRKGVDYNQIYDISAVRVLVPTIEDCYTVLSIVHSLWQQIPQEFDDYIVTPKENGYRSIHTAVIGPAGRNVEVQIRTFDMHHESELGIAAHWRYKENKSRSSYDAKIAWLRQILAWQKEINVDVEKPLDNTTGIFDERIYVFTPAGEIVDLPRDATPLDFAYHIHSEIGHRCRGAKVNGAIVPLTYHLNTGERIEILTTKQANPSRDWLNPHLGYLKTARARAKVHHWFKTQDQSLHITDGQTLLEKELRRLEINNVNLQEIADKLHYKSPKELYAALGCGDLRISQILNLLQAPKPTDIVQTLPTHTEVTAPAKGIMIQGVGNLLTAIAKCCKPIPGDDIIGFITQNRGVTIHRKECRNILAAHTKHLGRVIEVSWGQEEHQRYPVDIKISAYDRQGLLRDITTLFTNEKMNVLAMNSHTDPLLHTANFTATIEIKSLDSLSRVMDKIMHLPNIVSVKRSL